MKYVLAFKPRARKDLKALGSENLQRVLEKIEALTDNLAGDVKRLTDYTPEFRLLSATTASCSRSTLLRLSFIVSFTAAKLTVDSLDHD